MKQLKDDKSEMSSKKNGRLKERDVGTYCTVHYGPVYGSEIANPIDRLATVYRFWHATCLLKVLEEILQLEEIVRTSKEDMKDLKNRVEQLEIFIENHHSSFVAHNSADILPKSPTTHDTQANTRSGTSTNRKCPIKPPKYDIESDDEIKRRFLTRRELLYDQTGLSRFKF